jgi:hypothetical protein
MFSIHGISIIDAYPKGTAESTWKSYKSGWNIFVKFLVEEKYNDTDWEYKKDCEKVYLEFLNWVFVGRKIPPSSINIACSVVSKFICVFITDFNFVQSRFVKNIKRGFMTNNPKKPKYPLIDYYYKNNENDLPLEDKYQFLQVKTAIVLGYLHMLRSQEAWSCEVVSKPELGLEINEGCWLRTIVKNDKTNISDIWIPNIDLLISYKDEIKINNTKQKEIGNQAKTNPLNVFYTIHLLKTMTLLPVKRLFVNRMIGNPISKSKYTMMMHKEIQKYKS